jgi:hypothetical protein
MSYYTRWSTQRHFPASFAHLRAEIRRIRPDAKLVSVRHQANLQHVLGWSAGQTKGLLRFCCLDDVNYRLSTRYLDGHFLFERSAARRLEQAGLVRQELLETELTFHWSELHHIRGEELVRFYEDCFQCRQPEEVYRWPLFCSGEQDYPVYAWSLYGWAQEQKREGATTH